MVGYLSRVKDKIDRHGEKGQEIKQGYKKLQSIYLPSDFVQSFVNVIVGHGLMSFILISY